MKPTNLLLLPLCLLLCAAGLCGCKKEVKPTTMSAVDSLRHYYPVIMGQKLHMSWEIHNTGKEPLVINDIQPSCGCIVDDAEGDKRIVLPEGKLILKFTYDSAKNLGYVHHTIRLFGNMKPRGMYNLVFDINVVPSSDNTRDYEELYNDEAMIGTLLVDGHANEKGYYTDEEGRENSH